jgi:GntR family transcriptional regulator
MATTASFHQQLIEKLRKLLRSRRFVPRAQFLTEREIAERFKTSRPTANKALSSLVSAGLLEIRPGAGTFVREGVLDYDLERLVSFTDKAKASGKKPGTDLIEFRKVTAAEVDPQITKQLRVSAEAVLFYMERIRLADGKPVIYERRHVIAAHCPSLTKADAKGSLYAAWTTKCRLQITGAEETIRAVNATAAQAKHLQVRRGTACFQIAATGFISGEQPLWHEETLYRADVYEFRNRIGGLGAAMGRLSL